jgi:hypothetical protein
MLLVAVLLMKSARLRKVLQHQVQSQLHLNGRGRERLAIRIVNIPERKQGKIINSPGESQPLNELNRAEIVRWVAESSRPLSIVKDRGFQSLMKTGRPAYWIPSQSTVARDVKLVFAKTRNRIARILKVRQPCTT